jgi:hypothetical protein
MNNEQDILDAVEQDPVPEKQSDLTIIQAKAVELRDLYQQKADLEARVKETSEKIQHVERHELIDLFDAAGISFIGVDPVGNYPAFVAQRITTYGSKKPTELDSQVYDWFETNGHGDLIKATITIQFGMQEHEERLNAMKLLAEHDIQFSSNIAIHNSTLKAFIKRELQAGHVIPMDLLGAYVFDEVKIK